MTWYKRVYENDRSVIERDESLGIQHLFLWREGEAATKIERKPRYSANSLLMITLFISARKACPLQKKSSLNRKIEMARKT